MKLIKVILLGLIAASSAKADELLEAQVAVTEIDRVVCISSGTLAVRDDSLRSILFMAKRGDRIKTFQGWGDVKKKKVINGKTYTFTKVQFPDRPKQEIGWVAEIFIKAPSACAGMPQPPAPEPDPSRPVTGIDDPRCCFFPLKNEPKVTYVSGVASFGASRSGGARRHAACDLYGTKNENIFSVAHGAVLRNLYFFYQGTYALEVKHSGGFVVRYGELSGKAVVQLNQKLNPGQTVGYMGKTDCCKPMLHLEVYRGTKSGPLSTRGNVYGRRSDLMNPTSYIRKWQEGAFSK